MSNKVVMNSDKLSRVVESGNYSISCVAEVYMMEAARFTTIYDSGLVRLARREGLAV